MNTPMNTPPRPTRQTPSRQTYTVPGLDGTVRISVDQWGVPHIRAASLPDVLYGQGFNVARERLWQLDTWRRCGLGKLAEVFGERFVERDRAARLFVYRGDSHTEWRAYASDAKECVAAFVRGINAWITLTRADATLLPLEFRALGYTADFWQPEDVTRIRAHGLFYNLHDEVARALTLRDYGPAVEALRRYREPQRALTIPDGLDLAALPEDVLRLYDLAVTPPDFAGLATALTPQAQQPAPEGSNNWVIAAQRSASGRALLANDPHRIMTTLPSMRYLVHLTAPGFDAIGGSEVGLPGIFTGHNGTAAFGTTFSAVDQEDLVCYELHPEDDARYRYQDKWEMMRTEMTEIAVAGEPSPRQVALTFTRHGPVIHVDAARRRAYAVRAAWLQPGMAPYLGSLSVMRARSWDEFFTASDCWRAPGANLVYADVHGDIGWKLAALTPRRRNWDGTLPVPGDGRYEWDGFFDGSELPWTRNPPEGWIATANEMRIPDDYPADRHLGYEWFARLRKDRITEVLASHDQHTVATSHALQNDAVSLLARRVLAHVRALTITPVPEHLARLLAWDTVVAAQSMEAALFEVWYSAHLRPALLRRAVAQCVAAEQVDAALARLRLYELIPDTRVLLDLLGQRDRLGADADAWLAQTVVTTLAAAEADLRQRLGDDPDQWRWGDLHQAWMQHPAQTLLADALPSHYLETERVARSGSGDTVGLTAYDATYRQIVGSTLRLVIDVGQWDNSVAMNAPGQSGRLDDAASRDLLHAWARGEALPLLYTAEKIAPHIVYEVVLNAADPAATDPAATDQ